MGKRKTHEEFVQEVFDLVGDEYDILGEYIDSKTKIEFLHKKCNTKWNASPNMFLSGSRCKTCYFERKSIQMNKTNDDFVSEVYNLVGDEYTVLDKYINTKTKIRFKHNKHNYIFSMQPSSFLLGHGCPICGNEKSKKTRTKTHNEFCQVVHDMHNDEYSVLGEYIKHNIKIKMKHNVCNHEWDTTPHNILRGMDVQCVVLIRQYY